MKAPPICLYLTVLVDGYVFGVNDGFYAFFLVDELGISQEWLGNIMVLILDGNSEIGLHV